MSSRWKHVWRIHGKKDINRITLLKECYATLWPNNNLIWHVVLDIQTLPMSLINKLQITQNAFIRICLGMERRSHIGLHTFEKINWLPVKNRVGQRMTVKTYSFKNNLSPVHISNIYSKSFSGCKSKKNCE